ncbi:hypothetical protein C2G38_2254530 [Gigaspora rosea]|uniref:Uncharacterized protein n=1 Tax=Gigaspora rosea TaxID=44941 RepID=A0A397UAL9_9GLOM|nr:hypothetical protein C2G38_2254530 [Gigaspora rosea]
MQLEEIDHTIWLEDYEQKPENIIFKIRIEKGRIGESKCLCALLNAGIPAFALNVEKSDGGIDIFGYYVNFGFNIQVKFLGKYNKTQYLKDLKKFWDDMKKFPENVGFFVYFSDINIHELKFEGYERIYFYNFNLFNYDYFKNKFGIKNIYNVLQRQEFKYFDINPKEIPFGDFGFHFVGNFKNIHFIIYDSTQGSFYNGTSQEMYINFMEVKKQFVPEYYYGFLIVENCEFETILNSVGKIFFTTWNNLHSLMKECVIKEFGFLWAVGTENDTGNGDSEGWGTENDVGNGDTEGKMVCVSSDWGTEKGARNGDQNRYKGQGMYEGLHYKGIISLFVAAIIYHATALPIVQLLYTSCNCNCPTIIKKRTGTKETDDETQTGVNSVETTFKGWTSGNKTVDDCIKEFSLKATSYGGINEWIPLAT